ncbi:MAG: hypothetical protein ABI663_10820 [Chryseolinea sp.]
MFNIFKKEKLLPLPPSYDGLINQKDYNLVVELCKKYLTKHDYKIINIGDGEIIVEHGDQEKHFYLDNLVRLLAQNSKLQWENYINEHFDKQKEIPFATDFLYKDFEYASQFIKAYLKPKATFEPDQVGDYVNRVDLPETYTFLILDFKEQFHFVRRDNIGEWNKTEEGLFEIGFANISNESIDIKESLLADKFPIYMFFSGDFSASFIIELERNAIFTIGTYGSIVAVPTKGSAFIHPIENNQVMEVIVALAELTKKFYDEDPGNITMDFYWFHHGKFDIFPNEPADNGYVTIDWPTELKQRLGLD